MQAFRHGVRGFACEQEVIFKRINAIRNVLQFAVRIAVPRSEFLDYFLQFLESRDARIQCAYRVRDFGNRCEHGFGGTSAGRKRTELLDGLLLETLRIFLDGREL